MNTLDQTNHVVIMGVAHLCNEKKKWREIGRNEGQLYSQVIPVDCIGCILSEELTQLALWTSETATTLGR